MSKEAQIGRCAFLISSAVFSMSIFATACFAASDRTENFVVTAPTKSLAHEIAKGAERFRRELAIEWLGRELPRWSQPCPIVARVHSRLPAGGETSFMFRHQRPFGWRMKIQGSRERIMDSVLPHEVTHTIFATHFGQPLPRWADEGACTTVEHASERKKQEDWLIRFIDQRRGIPFNRMFAMTDYPSDIMPLYAQGHSVSEFLIGQGGKRKFIQFIDDGLATNNWHRSLNKFYSYERIGDLQHSWEIWVSQGRPHISSPNGDNAIRLVSNQNRSEDSWRRSTPTSRKTGSKGRPKIEFNETFDDVDSPLAGDGGSYYAKIVNNKGDSKRVSDRNRNETRLKTSADRDQGTRDASNWRPFSDRQQRLLR